MNICLVYHTGSLYGGHLDFSDEMVKGFKTLGHTCEFLLLTEKKSGKKNSSLEKVLQETSGIDNTGKYIWEFSFYENINCWGNVEKGFIKDAQPYQTEKEIEFINNKLDSYDLVIWQDLGNFNQKTNRDFKNINWLKLFRRKTGVSQIMILHEHNLYGRYPFVSIIRQHFDNVIAVHPASFNKAKNLGLPTFLIPNPHDLSDVDFSHSNYINKEKRIAFSMGAWKSSKRFQDIVSAIPYFDNINMVMAGDGTEKRYMVTNNPEKMKKEYICTIESDQDVDINSLTGDPIKDGIWTRALKNNLNYVGTISKNTREKYYSDAFLFIDPAWYKENLKIGAHFSRVIIEAMKKGILPIGRNLGLSNNEEGDGILFKSNINYIMIPWNATPKEFGDIVNSTFNFSKDKYDEIVFNNYNLIKRLETSLVCEQYIDSILPKRTDYILQDQIKFDKELEEKAISLLTGESSKCFGVSIEELNSLKQKGFIDFSLKKKTEYSGSIFGDV